MDKHQRSIRNANRAGQVGAVALCLACNTNRFTLLPGLLGGYLIGAAAWLVWQEFWNIYRPGGEP